MTISEDPFDQVAESQQKARTEADAYRFFIHAGFINNIDEIKKLYTWFDCDWSIRDPQGKTRIRLLRKIPDTDLFELVDFRDINIQPSRLSAELLRRIAPHL